MTYLDDNNLKEYMFCYTMSVEDTFILLSRVITWQYSHSFLGGNLILHSISPLKCQLYLQ